MDYYYVIALAGQSNGMAYGEGIPLPESIDKPDPRIKQLARRNTETPNGKKCQYNSIILADHCLHDVQDMSLYHHPLANLMKGQYGCVGQGLHIAKKLLPFIPPNAGILLVPCCRGGSAFTQGNIGSFSHIQGASPDACRWGENQPLFEDLVTRTQSALSQNTENRLLAVCWMQGEFDLISPYYQEQPLLFNKMIEKFNLSLTPFKNQCVDQNPFLTQWLCGDTTYYWKERYPDAYQCIYGNYQKNQNENVIFIPLQYDDFGQKVKTNHPIEDNDELKIGYYGSSHRSDLNWTTELRSSHFSTQSRRGIIAARFSTHLQHRVKILNTTDLFS